VAIPCPHGDCFGAFAPRNDRIRVSLRAKRGNLHCPPPRLLRRYAPRNDKGRRRLATTKEKDASQRQSKGVIASEAWQSPLSPAEIASSLRSSQRQRKKTPRNDKGRRHLAMTEEGVIASKAWQSPLSPAEIASSLRSSQRQRKKTPRNDRRGCHCEQSVAISIVPRRDCFVATLLATTKEKDASQRQSKGVIASEAWQSPLSLAEIASSLRSSQRQRKKTPRNDKGRRRLAMTRRKGGSP